MARATRRHPAAAALADLEAWQERWAATADTEDTKAIIRTKYWLRKVTGQPVTRIAKVAIVNKPTAAAEALAFANVHELKAADKRRTRTLATQAKAEAEAAKTTIGENLAKLNGERKALAEAKLERDAAAREARKAGPVTKMSNGERYTTQPQAAFPLSDPKVPANALTPEPTCQGMNPEATPTKLPDSPAEVETPEGQAALAAAARVAAQARRDADREAKAADRLATPAPKPEKRQRGAQQANA